MTRVLWLGGSVRSDTSRHLHGDLTAGNHVGADINGDWDTLAFWTTFRDYSDVVRIIAVDIGSDSWIQNEVLPLFVHTMASLDPQHIVMLSISDETRYTHWTRVLVEKLSELGVVPHALLPYRTPGLANEIAILFQTGTTISHTVPHAYPVPLQHVAYTETWTTLVRTIELVRGHPQENNAGEWNGLYDRAGYHQGVDFDDVVTHVVDSIK